MYYFLLLEGGKSVLPENWNLSVMRDGYAEVKLNVREHRREYMKVYNAFTDTSPAGTTVHEV